MAEAATKSKPTGRTFNFNLTGDDLFLYETVRATYEDELEDADDMVSTALDGLEPHVRALIQSRFSPGSAKKELSHRQVFVRALQAALDSQDAAEDAHEAAEATEVVEEAT